MNSDKPWPSLVEAETWVLCIQRKLHRWTKDDEQQRYGDLFNLVYERHTLRVAWERVKRNRGSRTAGVDGHTRLSIEHGGGVEAFLEGVTIHACPALMLDKPPMTAYDLTPCFVPVQD